MCDGRQTCICKLPDNRSCEGNNLGMGPCATRERLGLPICPQCNNTKHVIQDTYEGRARPLIMLPSDYDPTYRCTECKILWNRYYAKALPYYH